MFFLLPAVQELQTSLSGLKRDGDELTLRLSERDRELAETRREVNNVIEKKRRLEQVVQQSSGKKNDEMLEDSVLLFRNLTAFDSIS